ncbi:hypothetical protein BH20CHL7_BH20CHL7_04090 [soil metagenome]
MPGGELKGGHRSVQHTQPIVITGIGPARISRNIPATATGGLPTDLTLTGDLTLHGVTRSVQIPVRAQLADGRIQVAGSLTFPLADFEIVAPT